LNTVTTTAFVTDAAAHMNESRIHINASCRYTHTHMCVCVYVYVCACVCVCAQYYDNDSVRDRCIGPHMNE